MDFRNDKNEVVTGGSVGYLLKVNDVDNNTPQGKIKKLTLSD